MIGFLILATAALASQPTGGHPYKILDPRVFQGTKPQANWFCAGPRFDSSCQPANGGNLHCHGFHPGEMLQTSYADNGRIAYCAFPK